MGSKRAVSPNPTDFRTKSTVLFSGNRHSGNAGVAHDDDPLILSLAEDVSNWYMRRGRVEGGGGRLGSDYRYVMEANTRHVPLPYFERVGVGI